MTLIPLVTLSLLLIGASAQSKFADYDYQDLYNEPSPPARSQPAPVQPSSRFSSRPNSGRAPTTAPPPPVAILKQINTQNDDGSYTYGYEAADGSFKIETKTVTGEVMGKYGYVDANGKLKTVEYGANRYGFQPSGEGITVPPPTLVDESIRRGPNGEIIEEDEEGQSQVYQSRPRPANQPRRPTQASRPRPPQQQPQQPIFESQPEQQQYAPAPRPRPRPQPQPQQQQPQQFNYAPQPYIAPVARAQPQQAHTPPRNFGPSSGPVPPRAQIAGAAPVQVPQAAPVFENPEQFQFSSQPRRAPASRPSQRSSSMLDNLAQQYALPQNAGSRPVAEYSFSDTDPAYSRSINF